MVEDRFFDLFDEEGVMNFNGWRCCQCGEISDPVIIKNRELEILKLFNSGQTKVDVGC